MSINNYLSTPIRTSERENTPPSSTGSLGCRLNFLYLEYDSSPSAGNVRSNSNDPIGTILNLESPNDLKPVLKRTINSVSLNDSQNQKPPASLEKKTDDVFMSMYTMTPSYSSSKRKPQALFLDDDSDTKPPSHLSLSEFKKDDSDLKELSAHDENISICPLNKKSKGLFSDDDSEQYKETNESDLDDTSSTLCVFDEEELLNDHDSVVIEPMGEKFSPTIFLDGLEESASISSNKPLISKKNGRDEYESWINFGYETDYGSCKKPKKDTEDCSSSDDGDYTNKKQKKT